MCGRFTMLTRDEVADAVRAVEQRQALVPLAKHKNRIHARPKSLILAFDEAYEISEMTWGFEFPWHRGPVFNARVESLLAGNGTWRNAVGDSRCVVPAASFFEPHATETAISPRTGKPMKRQYEFANADGTPLLLAGVYADGCCSVVTTEPNVQVASIHNRMPVVLDAHEVEEWLTGDWTALANRAALRFTVAPEVLAMADDTQAQGVRAAARGHQEPGQLALF